MIGKLDGMLKLVLPILLVATSAAQGVAEQPGASRGNRPRLAQHRNRDRATNPDQRPGFRGRRGFGNGDGPRRLSDEQLESVLEFVKQNFPERLGEITALRENNPDMFRRRAGRMFPRILQIMQRSERNPEAGALMLEEDRLGFQINRLVEQFFDTDDSDQIARTRRELRDLVARRFEVRQRQREMEVRRLERRLEAIRMQLQRDADRREERIDDALAELGIGAP